MSASIASLAFVLGVIELLMIGKLTRKYGVHFLSKDAMDMFVAKASLEDFIKIRAHLIGVFFMFSLAGILVFRPWN